MKCYKRSGRDRGTQHITAFNVYLQFDVPLKKCVEDQEETFALHLIYDDLLNLLFTSTAHFFLARSFAKINMRYLFIVANRSP